MARARGGVEAGGQADWVEVDLGRLGPLRSLPHRIRRATAIMGSRMSASEVNALLEKVREGARPLRPLLKADHRSLARSRTSR